MSKLTSQNMVMFFNCLQRDYNTMEEIFNMFWLTWRTSTNEFIVDNVNLPQEMVPGLISCYETCRQTLFQFAKLLKERKKQINNEYEKVVFKYFQMRFKPDMRKPQELEIIKKSLIENIQYYLEQ